MISPCRSLNSLAVREAIYRLALVYNKRCIYHSIGYIVQLLVWIEIHDPPLHAGTQITDVHIVTGV